MKWYIVHTYSGYEHKAKAALEERVRSLHKEDKIGKVLVPIERVQELGKGGARKVSSRKFFPGYIFVRWCSTTRPGTSSRTRRKSPASSGIRPIRPKCRCPRFEEIEQQMEEGALRPKPKVLFEVGEAIKVVDGPFQDFNGTVEEVKPEKGKVRVLISIFGRATPVELDFVQVEKA